MLHTMKNIFLCLILVGLSGCLDKKPSPMKEPKKEAEITLKEALYLDHHTALITTLITKLVFTEQFLKVNDRFKESGLNSKSQAEIDGMLLKASIDIFADSGINIEQLLNTTYLSIDEMTKNADTLKLLKTVYLREEFKNLVIRSKKVLNPYGSPKLTDKMTADDFQLYFTIMAITFIKKEKTAKLRSEIDDIIKIRNQLSGKLKLDPNSEAAKAYGKLLKLNN